MARHHINHDRCAPDCDDQLPVFSRVGRGIKGDSFKVDIASDSNCETILEGMSFDEASREWTSEWISENVNGGCLSYQYVLRPYTIPQTFTITFIYKRPGRREWSWTTPAIPYIWTKDDDGNQNPGDPDTMVGSGVATLFVKTTTAPTWTEKLVYPAGTDRDDYNAPDPLEPWTVNLTFGIGGDIEVPNLDDIAKIIGISVDDIKKIIQGDQVTINGIQVDNVIDYIDKKDDGVLDHVHDDLGFDDGFLPGDGGDTSVKKYIDGIKTAVNGDVAYLKNALADILAKIYGGGELGADGHITWPNTSKIPVADINLFGGTASPSNATYSDALRSRSISDNDLKAV